ncbi:hypothetical protein GCM10022626_09740 [[Pseudomonas] carboxydohydrogena]
MTRRCSVMRMPVAAQRDSMSVDVEAGTGFTTGMDAILPFESYDDKSRRITMAFN